MPLNSPVGLDSWLKTKAQKCKAIMLMRFLSLVVLAIYQLRLFGMQLQFKALQSLPYRRQQMFGFGLTVAVYNDVIGITLKRIGCKVLAHPHIKGVVQVQVG